MQKQFAHLPKDQPVIALTHIYDAPRALVWEAFTKPEQLMHWWGPDGFTIEHDSADIRAGGFWKFVMVGPDGTRWDNYHQFTEFSPMDVIAHKHGGSHAEDTDAWEARITFVERDGRTEVTLTHTFPDMAGRARVLAFHADTLGLQTLAKAEAYMTNTMRAE